MYKVTMQHPNRSKRVLGIFSDERDARLFVRARLEWDEKINSLATCYEIINNNQVIQTSQWDKSQGQSQNQQKSFHPTPMPTVLRPPGSPPYIPEDEDDN